MLIIPIANRQTYLLIFVPRLISVMFPIPGVKWPLKPPIFPYLILTPSFLPHSILLSPSISSPLTRVSRCTSCSGHSIQSGINRPGIRLHALIGPAEHGCHAKWCSPLIRQGACSKCFLSPRIAVPACSAIARHSLPNATLLANGFLLGCRVLLYAVSSPTLMPRSTSINGCITAPFCIAYRIDLSFCSRFQIKGSEPFHHIFLIHCSFFAIPSLTFNNHCIEIYN